jgi:predicted NBD/HSP70 family sugar kinase
LWNVIRQRASLIREPNEVRILRLVRDRGEISRIEIAKSTDLHKATITDLVSKLIQTGFLEETGEVEARKRVGRKRILLRFRPMAGLVAGVDIRKTGATVALTDLNARILRQESFQYPLDAPATEVLSLVITKIQRLLAATNHSQAKLVGIGIGVQGVIDYATNTLVLSHDKKSWQGESLSADLETKFNIPVYVENDVKTMTLGEYLLGSAKGTKDFVHIWVGDGLGAGIMINGHLLHGTTSSAGEIGYNGPEVSSFYREKFPMTYRNQVMFGQILTDANFIESYRRASGHADRDGLTVALITQKAGEGDAKARQIIEEFASILSIVCIDIVNTLNPEMIVLGGELAQSYPMIADLLQEKIHRDLLVPAAEAVRVRPAKHGENGVILGAAGLVLYELFEPLHTFSVRTARRQKTLMEKEPDFS